MNQTYTRTAKVLHWLMAILLIGLIALGLYMHDLPFSPERLKLYSWHKWAGMMALLLVFARLAWRVKNRPPALPSSMPKLMQLLAHLGHLALYGFMLAIPLSGWLMSSANGYTVVLFGVLPIPDLVQRNKELGHLLGQVHTVLNYLFIATITGHFAVALKHHFIDKDDILTRMLPAHNKENQP